MRITFIEDKTSEDSTSIAKRVIIILVRITSRGIIDYTRENKSSECKDKSSDDKSIDDNPLSPGLSQVPGYRRNVLQGLLRQGRTQQHYTRKQI